MKITMGSHTSEATSTSSSSSYLVVGELSEEVGIVGKGLDGEAVSVGVDAEQLRSICVVVTK